jgi:hypothetical protein
VLARDRPRPEASEAEYVMADDVVSEVVRELVSPARVRVGLRSGEGYPQVAQG